MSCSLRHHTHGSSQVLARLTHHPPFVPPNLESWLMLGLGASPLPTCPVPNGPIAETLRSLIDRSIADALLWSVAALAFAAPVVVTVEVLLAGAGELGPP
jgi:hypothetical protein